MKNKRRSRGFAHERDLVRKLWEKGFAVIRAPASGAKARRYAVPDIVAIRQGVVLAFEVKTIHDERPVYIPKHQVDKLLEFTKRAGGKPYIAVKIIGVTGWRFIPVEELEETRGGNYRVSVERIHNSLRLPDIVSLMLGNKLLTDYASSGKGS